MKKDELLYLHMLLDTVSDRFQRYGMPEERLARYSELGVSPNAIHKGKPEQEEAVVELLEALSGWAEDADSDDDSDGEGDRRALEA